MKGVVGMFLKNNILKKYNLMSYHTLTIVAAPDGYGKSTSLTNYLKKEKKQSVWINVNDTCNMTSIWEEMIDKSFALSALPRVLTNTKEFYFDCNLLSFIETWDLSLKDELFVVIDDFHKMKSGEFITFLEHLTKWESKYLHFVLVGQYMENTTIAQWFDQKKCYTLSIQDFKLDLYDLIRYCKQREIHIEKEKLQVLLRYSDGWLPAIDLALSALLEGRSLFSTTNIKALMAKAEMADISDMDIIALIKLSYLEDFDINQMHFICEYDQIENLIKKLSSSNLFLQKMDFERYEFTEICKAYLYEAQLNYQIDIRKVHQRIADWYIDRDDLEKAVPYLLKCHDFEKALYLIKNEVFHNVDLNVSLLDEVFRKLPIKYKFDNPYLYLYFIKKIIIYSDPNRGKFLLDNFREQVENDEFIGDKEDLLNEYYFVRAFTKFNDFSAMMSDFYLALERYKNPYSHGRFPQIALTYGSYQILYLYHRQGGQLHSLLKCIQSSAHVLMQLDNGVNSGIEYLVQAEYFYIIGRYEHVESLAEAAYKMAYVSKHTSMAIASLFLIARYALRVNKIALYQSKVADLVKLRMQVTSTI